MIVRRDLQLANFLCGRAKPAPIDAKYRLVFN
jgi:hypothetical protein